MRLKNYKINTVYKNSLKAQIITRKVFIFSFLYFTLITSVFPIDRFKERKEMVEYQIKARGITDERVLQAMLKVKRHLFVPLSYRAFAYQDTALPIGWGQTISQPYIVALMTQLLNLKGDEKVLEIGTGSGYQAAILAELTKEVYTIEIIEPLAKRAENLLKKLGYRNIFIKVGDGFFGWPEKAPFDAIIVTCAPDTIPQPLIDQLKEGGRLVIPVGKNWQTLKLLEKKDGKIFTKDIIGVIFVPMIREPFMNKNEDNSINIQNLKKHIRVLSEEIGERNFLSYQNLEKSAEYIKDEFIKYGYIVKEHIYYIDKKPYKNIIATKEGRNKNKILIVCAHYDSVVGSSGADDNASGVAGLLEMANILKDEALNYTVSFIAFVNEEPPFFATKNMGSFVYAKEIKKKKQDIIGVICLESLGYYSEEKNSQKYPVGLNFFYPDKANFIAFISNLSSKNFLKAIFKQFKTVSNFPAYYLIAPQVIFPEIGFSDHSSFWKFGYRAIMVTDTAFYRNPNYHTLKDTYQTINYEYLGEVIRGLSLAIKNYLNSLN